MRTCSGTITIGWCATTAVATISPTDLLRAERALLDRDVFHIAEEVKAPRAALAADAGVARASERRIQIAHEVAVDPDGSGDDLRRHALLARCIARVQHRSQAVFGAVGERDGFGFGCE